MLEFVSEKGSPVLRWDKRRFRDLEALRRFHGGRRASK